MKHKTVAIFLIVGLAFFLTSIIPVNAADITISGNEEIVIDSDYTQTGNITIQDSGTLIVKNGATLTASGSDITVKGHGTLKIENGILKANKLSLYDDAKLEMTQNSKMNLANKFLANDRTSITVRNARIGAHTGFDATCKNIELSSAMLGAGSIYIDVQSFSISDSALGTTRIYSTCFVSIKSTSGVSILNSTIGLISSIKCPSLLISGSTVVFTHTWNSQPSEVIIPSKVTISNSHIKKKSGSFIINSDLVSLTTSTISGANLYINSDIASVTNVSVSSVSAKDKTLIYRYWYLTTKITDNFGNPVSNAKVDVLYYLNETTYKSETTDSNGVAVIPVLSNIITSQKDEFVGNYKVIAHYQNYTTAKRGVEMKNNMDIPLKFTDLCIEPSPSIKPSPSIESPNNTIISILVYLIVLIAAAIFIILWVRKHKPPTDKDKLEISIPIKSKPSTVTPIYNIEEVSKYAECPYCGSNIRDTFYELGGIVRCDKCGAFHHRECFEFYGGKCGSPTCKL